MNDNRENVATLDDLIARKLEREKEKSTPCEIQIASLGKALLFEHPGEREAISLLDDVTSRSTTADVYDAYVQMIYKCCPALHSEKLREQADVKIPTDIVGKIMTISDVMETGDKLMGFLGIVSVSEKVKN